MNRPSKSRLILFTSMSSSDVLCEPGKSAEGVRILKSYLEYAERGGKTGGTLTGKRADSDFEVLVAERLRRRGYPTYREGLSALHHDGDDE
jgi:hypothetical protein